MARSTTILNISLSPEEDTQIEELAKQEATTKSGLVRQALKAYRLNKSLDMIRDIGERSALSLGIDSFDDIEKLAG